MMSSETASLTVTVKTPFALTGVLAFCKENWLTTLALHYRCLIRFLKKLRFKKRKRFFNAT